MELIMLTATELGMLCATEKKAAGFSDILSSPAFYGPVGGAALGGLAGAGISTAMTGQPHMGAILGGELGGIGLGGLYGYLNARSSGRKQLDALRSKRKKELSEEDVRNIQALAAMENELSPSETKKAADSVNAQMNRKQTKLLTSLVKPKPPKKKSTGMPSV
jgi:hypothetical protein